MPLYRFDLGNSTEGCVGAVAVIRAEHPKGAVEALKKIIGEMTVEIKDIDLKDGEYVNVYLNANNATVWDVERAG